MVFLGILGDLLFFSGIIRQSEAIKDPYEAVSTMECHKKNLGGGTVSNIFYVPIVGEMIPFDEHIFQMG